MYAKDELMNSKSLVRIRDPIRKEDQELVAKVIDCRKWDSPGNQMFIAGADRSFDKHSDSYGNSFTDFIEWPHDKPMDGQVQAEFFINMCFTDAIVRMGMNQVLTQDQADRIMWMAKKGMLVSAAACVNYILSQKKGGETDGAETGSTADADE